MYLIIVYLKFANRSIVIVLTTNKRKKVITVQDYVILISLSVMILS